MEETRRAFRAKAHKQAPPPIVPITRLRRYQAKSWSPMCRTGGAAGEAHTRCQRFTSEMKLSGLLNEATCPLWALI
jgi:hypothetical protein